jgi:tRNA pseudouridine38-40 synthase
LSGRVSEAMQVKATVAYDGTDYQGFQRQVNGPTVQEALENALKRLTQTMVKVLAAGRTDAGVHAEGQVIAFDTVWRHQLSDLERAMNAVLPQDIAVRDLVRVSPDFHPRYDACSRRYRYTVYNAPVRSPLARRTSLYVNEPLDLKAMRQATALAVGEHDFAAFGRPPQGEVTVRRVVEAVWIADPPWLFFEIEANAFLFRMVRSLVGTLLWVGQGRLSPGEFGRILASRDRRQAGKTAPAHGLCMIKVRY